MGVLKVPIAIRGMKADDVPFIHNSFVRSADYFGSHIESSARRAISRILERQQVFVAHPVGDEDTIVGYVIAGTDLVHTLWFAYTKQPYRRFGIADALIEHALNGKVEEFVFIGNRKLTKALVRKYSSRHNPFLWINLI